MRYVAWGITEEISVRDKLKIAIRASCIDLTFSSTFVLSDQQSEFHFVCEPLHHSEPHMIRLSNLESTQDIAFEGRPRSSFRLQHAKTVSLLKVKQSKQSFDNVSWGHDTRVSVQEAGSKVFRSNDY